MRRNRHRVGKPLEGGFGRKKRPFHEQNGGRMETNHAGMGRSQRPIGRVHTFMPFGGIVRMGRLVLLRFLSRGFRCLILPMSVMVAMVAIMPIEDGPYIPYYPTVGMGGFNMGTLMVFVRVGMEKEERRQGEKGIGEQHKTQEVSASRFPLQPMKSENHVLPWAISGLEVQRKVQMDPTSVKKDDYFTAYA
jgi:hypothetical protein